MLKKVLAAAGLMAAMTTGANASTLISVSIFDAVTYNSDFGQGSNVAEDFEQLGAVRGEGEVGASLDTAVGTFTTLGGEGSGGTVSGLPDNNGKQLALRDGNVFGRTNNAPLIGDWFLDSNDTFGMSWEVSLGGAAFNSLSFVLQDASDSGAFMRISAGGADFETRTGNKLADGNAKLVVIDFGEALTEATVLLGNYTVSEGNEFERNDGFSVDGMQVSAVPLPAPILMLGTALAGFGVMRRRQKRKAA